MECKRNRRARRMFCSAMALATAATNPVLAVDTKSTRAHDAVAVVAKLYHDYGWETFAPASGPGADVFGRPLAEQPKEILSRYFDTPLASAIANDAECVARNGGICHLDFDILFASQDPGASDLGFSITAPDRVVATFTYPSNGEKITIEFRVVQTSAGPRIDDVIYRSLSDASLRRLLSGNP